MGMQFSTLLRAILAGATARTYPATFNVLLSNPVGCTISDSTIAVTIQSNPIIPRVSLSRTTGKAPLLVGFDATLTTSPLTTNPNHDLFYAWSFGDAAGETWAYGATVGLDKNLAYGPVAGHVFKTAGTYTWTLTVMDGRGNIATSSGSVVVSAWAEADTYYVSTGTGQAAGANGIPADAVGGNIVQKTTWADVVALWAPNKRIMLKRGDTWACSATTVVPAGCEINSYGAGANPNVTSAGATQTPFALNAGQADVRVCYVKHTGPGPGVDNSHMVATSIVTPSHLLMLGLESDGSTSGFLVASPEVHEVGIQDCYFHGYGVTGLATNIAAYISHGYGVYLLGSFFDQAPSHVVRISGGQRVVVDSCKFRRPDGAGNGRDALTIRELGNNSNVWNGLYTEDVIVSNVDIDASGTTSDWTLHIGHTNTEVAGRFRRVLVERNIVISDKQCFASTVGEHLTVRSNIFKTDNYPTAVGIGVSRHGVTVCSPLNPSPANPQFYNNTIYNSGGGAFAAFQLGTTSVGTAVTDAVIRNNLVYAPNATTPTLLSTGMQGVTGTVSSNNSSGAQMLSTRPWTSATPSVPTDYTPTDYALGGGVFDYRSQKDFFNAAITAPVDMGAIQA